MNREDDLFLTCNFSIVTDVLVERVNRINSRHSVLSRHRILPEEMSPMTMKNDKETNLLLMHRERKCSGRELIPYFTCCLFRFFSPFDRDITNEIGLDQCFSTQSEIGIFQKSIHSFNTFTTTSHYSKNERGSSRPVQLRFPSGMTSTTTFQKYTERICAPT